MSTTVNERFCNQAYHKSASQRDSENRSGTGVSVRMLELFCTLLRFHPCENQT